MYNFYMIHHLLAINLGFLSANVNGLDFFRIQEEVKSPYLAIGKILNFITHFKVTI